jgi:acetoin utilization protein AcuB
MKTDELSCLRWMRSPTIKTARSIQVRHRMSLSPVTIKSSAPLEDAIRLLVKHNIRELPVVEHGKLIGIVTDRDIRQVSPSYPVFRDEEEIRDRLRQLTVSCAMSLDPVVVSPATDLTEAASLMIQYRIGSLPVVDGGRLVGIISVTDLLKLFVEQNERGGDGKRGGRHGYACRTVES